MLTCVVKKRMRAVTQTQVRANYYAIIYGGDIKLVGIYWEDLRNSVQDMGGIIVHDMFTPNIIN